MEEIIEEIKASKLPHFIGEVYYEELQDLLGKEGENHQFWIQCCGMNSRSFSQDVIDSSFPFIAGDQLREDVLIKLSRNSLYHQLPEIFFHPLVISDPTMSNKEVVEAIKKNRELEEQNLAFFIPFDTFLFQEKVKYTNRFLHLFTNKDATRNIFRIARTLIQNRIRFSKEQYYKLFLNLCNSEELKENLPELEKLVQSILGVTCEIKYTRKELDGSIFGAINEGILGINLGLTGNLYSEFEDLEVTLLFEDSKEFEEIAFFQELTKEILRFFVFANRDIIVKFRFTSIVTNELSESYLGYNFCL